MRTTVLRSTVTPGCRFLLVPSPTRREGTNAENSKALLLILSALRDLRRLPTLMPAAEPPDRARGGYPVRRFLLLLSVGLLAVPGSPPAADLGRPLPLPEPPALDPST